MMRLRKADQRGYADHGWLQSWHSFSFADYYDANHMHFGPLRVINDDWIAPDNGFGMHGHRDMEIISYVLAGELSHKDSMGNGSVIRPGAVQRMSAGKGVLHSEYNHGQDTTHLLQIWIHPSQPGGSPSYEEKVFPTEEKQGRLRLVASPDGREGSVSMQQDALLYVGLFDGAQQASLALRPGRLAYVHLARGALQVNGQALQAGDALLLQDEAQISISQGEAAEVLVFDLPPQ
ncbi:pirin family protein [Massilia sp. W12]|uniref:pirin family protein n=1 Tax=Massilia sp. W12 TaxID=3126507 RepID=UPI0030D5DE60